MNEIISNSPGTLLLAFLLSQLVLFLARKPIREALVHLGNGVWGSLRLTARWCRGLAKSLDHRNREILLERARMETGKKLEKELVRVQDGFAKELKLYPQMHHRLEGCVNKLETDLEASVSVPPEAPGWIEAVEALEKMPPLGDRGPQRILEEIQAHAKDADRKALKEYQHATAKKHKILHGMGSCLKETKTTLAKTNQSVTTALETAAKVDNHMDRYEKIIRQEDGITQALAFDTIGLFAISLIVTAIAAGGAFVNFHLIALPMSELVPAASRVAGYPVSSIAALVLVLMETAAGLFLLEALGITELFPKMGSLPNGKRRLILGVSLTALFILAGIESSLAVLREQIVAADIELKQALAGTAIEAETTTLSAIPVVGQAVLGFVLPWILAMVAVPLEMLIASSRIVFGKLLVGIIMVIGNSARVVGQVTRYGCRTLAALVDMYVALPLYVEGLFRRKRSSKQSVKNRSSAPSLPPKSRPEIETGVA